MSLRPRRSNKKKADPNNNRKDEINNTTDYSSIFCCICLSNSGKNSCRLYPCLHGFCKQCIFNWTRIKITCPLCISKIDSIMFNIVNERVYDEYYTKTKTFVLGSDDTSPENDGADASPGGN